MNTINDMTDHNFFMADENVRPPAMAMFGRS